jgi:hypothetical protein
VGVDVDGGLERSDVHVEIVLRGLFEGEGLRGGFGIGLNCEIGGSGGVVEFERVVEYVLSVMIQCAVQRMTSTLGGVRLGELVLRSAWWAGDERLGSGGKLRGGGKKMLELMQYPYVLKKPM